MTTATNELATSSAPGATAIDDLIRRRGDLEVPALGTWSVVRASHVGLALAGRRDHPVPATVVDGTFDIQEDPELSEVHLHLRGPDAMTFLGTPTKVVGNRHGFSEWSIAGTLTHDGRAEAMTFTVSYHGVFATRSGAWAWFAGTGVVETPQKRAWWRRSDRVERRMVVLDLLLKAPSSPSRTEDIPCTP